MQRTVSGRGAPSARAASKLCASKLCERPARARTLLYCAAKAGVPVRPGLFTTVPLHCPSTENSATKGRLWTAGRGRQEQAGGCRWAASAAWTGALILNTRALRQLPLPSHGPQVPACAPPRTWAAHQLPIEQGAKQGAMLLPPDQHAGSTGDLEVSCT